MEPFPGCSSFELLEPEVKVEQAAANETLFRQGLGAADSGQSLSSETRSWGPSGPDTTGSIQRDVENRRSSVSSAPSSSATSTVQHFPGHRYMTPEYVPPGGVADEPDTPRDEPADGRDSMADVIEAVQTKRGSKRKDKGPEEESKAWKRTARKLSPRRTMHGPDAAPRRGEARYLPCVACVRKLANNPSWVCHDTIIGQYGVKSYKGVRCSECIGTHLTCHEVPLSAVELVQALVEAAAEATAFKEIYGSDDSDLYGAYKSAIGPAIEALVAMGAQSYQLRASKGKQAPKKTRRAEKKERRPAWGQEEVTRETLPRASKAQAVCYNEYGMYSDLDNALASDEHDNAPAMSPEAEPEPEPGSFMSPCFAPGLDVPRVKGKKKKADQKRIDSLERQALRRRKVEAVEAIAHSQTLLLAELQALNRNIAQQQRAGSSRTSL